MFEKLFTGEAPLQNVTDIVLGWRWATAHPLYHTIIKMSSSPYLLVVFIIVGGQLIARLLWRDRGGRR